MQAVPRAPAMQGNPPIAPSPSPSPGPRGDELVPNNNLNNYVRSKLSKSEVPSFSDCARALGELHGCSPSQITHVAGVRNQQELLDTPFNCLPARI